MIFMTISKKKDICALWRHLLFESGNTRGLMYLYAVAEASVSAE